MNAQARVRMALIRVKKTITPEAMDHARRLIDLELTDAKNVLRLRSHGFSVSMAVILLKKIKQEQSAEDSFRT